MLLTSPEIAQETTRRWRSEGRIAIVPTMGAIHEGHLCLVRRAKSLADRTVVSIFVNPLQFGPHEDLKNYPRPFEEDERLLAKEGVDLIFHPTIRELYPEGFQSGVRVGGLAKNLCGASRHGHFDGVATVCLKLFEILSADIAVFGEKDFQQLRVIEQMASDFNLSISILSHPIVRDSDGLALSSRNRYLTPNERAVAPRIFKALSVAQTSGPTTLVGEILDRVKRDIGSDFSIDYVEIASSYDLVPQQGSATLDSVSGPRLFIAAKLGHTRLIDNIRLGTP